MEKFSKMLDCQQCYSSPDFPVLFRFV